MDRIITEELEMDKSIDYAKFYREFKSRNTNCLEKGYKCPIPHEPIEDKKMKMLITRILLRDEVTTGLVVAMVACEKTLGPTHIKTP